MNDSRTNRMALMFLAPAATVLLLVVAYPFLYNIGMSFTNWNMYHFRDPSFNGLQNYGRLFLEERFWTILFKTFLWTGVNLVFHFTLGLSAALLLNRRLPARPIYRALLILPWAMPQYISALTWRGMFNLEYGVINLMLGKLGIAPVGWFSGEGAAFSAAIITNIWLGFPFIMVVALGGLQSIPRELYEAARIDGASAWRQFHLDLQQPQRHLAGDRPGPAGRQVPHPGDLRLQGGLHLLPLRLRGRLLGDDLPDPVLHRAGLQPDLARGGAGMRRWKRPDWREIRRRLRNWIKSGGPKRLARTSWTHVWASACVRGTSSTRPT